MSGIIEHVAAFFGFHNAPARNLVLPSELTQDVQQVVAPTVVGAAIAFDQTAALCQ